MSVVGAGKHSSLANGFNTRRSAMKWSTLFVRLIILLLAPAALITSSAEGFLKAKANISGPNGITGTALLVEDGNGNVVVTVFVKGPPTVLVPGRHGIHIHEVGLCEAP